MKRFITFLLALTMIASMGSIAYADDGASTNPNRIEGIDGSASVGVSGVYEEGEEPATVYKVNVSWQSMTFSCVVTGTREWDPATHTYVDKTGFEWKRLDDNPGTEKSRTVTVKNYSNKPVQVTAKFDGAGNTYGIETYVHPDSYTLGTRADGPYVDVDEVFDVGINSPSKPEIDMPESFTIGTLTITVTTPAPAAP